MLAKAIEWDRIFKNLSEKDGSKLVKCLKDASSLCVRTETMIDALAEMKKNQEWITEAQRIFENQSRH